MISEEMITSNNVYITYFHLLSQDNISGMIILSVITIICHYCITNIVKYLATIPVSYTHLDVYKRQGEDRLRERGSLPAAFFYQGYFLWQTITAANSNRIK